MRTTTSACSTASVSYTFAKISSPTSLALLTPASSTSYYQTPLVQVNGGESSATATLYKDSSCSQVIGSDLSLGGVAEVQSDVLPVGTHTLYAKFTNSSGGYSDCSTASLTYTVTSRLNFETFQTINAGNYSSAATLGDFNDDTKEDILYVGSSNQLAGIIPGNGDGTFQAKVDLGAMGYSKDVVSADFNADSKLDFAVSESNGSLRIVLGNGDGTFQDPVSIDGGVYNLESGDLDEDGAIDLIFCSVYPYNLGVMFGNGDGTFQNAVTSALGNQCRDLKVDDVNGDGHLDVVTSISSSDIQVRINQGDGTLDSGTSYSVHYANRIVIKDLNADTFPDIVAINNLSTARVHVLLNQKNGTFVLDDSYEFIGSYPNAVDIGDLDGDGKMDIAVAHPGGSEVVVFFGLGDGTFELPLYFSVNSQGVQLWLRDVDGDSDLDMLQLSQQSPTSKFSLLENTLVP